jgi:hypothetical protein
MTVDLPVRLVVSPGVVVWGRVCNVSMTGACIHSAQPMPAGALVSIEPISETGHWPPNALEATVIWARDGDAGLEWCEPRDAAPWQYAARAIGPTPRGANIDAHQLTAYRELRRA